MINMSISKEITEDRFSNDIDLIKVHFELQQLIIGKWIRDFYKNLNYNRGIFVISA